VVSRPTAIAFGYFLTITENQSRLHQAPQSRIGQRLPTQGPDGLNAIALSGQTPTFAEWPRVMVQSICSSLKHVDHPDCQGMLPCRFECYRLK
jgi:hypothetical protein